ncbi:hypothetical protein FXV77_05560 [Sphingobacterium phlebotomi]|uniref:Uncharacterized protein n=1 Tax=Sphingobacterium phlebotomi TaxID=2605433 RepID=A0A5D4HAX2_9SPHI|nr:hypothetical protein [Sphingobacterium phlebotomi]TYR37472.1 hypothetical protein FXV77_05560 [Sphingobacterium phlebotomi]
MKLKNSIFGLALMGVLFVGCNKQSDIGFAPESDGLTESELSTLARTSGFTITEKGYIRFDDLASFQAVVGSLDNEEDSVIAAWESSIGFSSLRAKFAALAETDEEYLNPVEGVDNFGAVINQDGVFAIGDTIHVVTYEKEYLITDGDESKIANVTSQNASSQNVETFNIERTPLRVAEIDGAPFMSAFATWSGTKGVTEPECTAPGRRERVVLEAFANNYASYGKIGARIKGEAYRKGGLFGSKKWRDDEVQYGKMQGVAKYYYAAPDPIMKSIWAEGWDKEQIRNIVDEYYTTPFYSSFDAEFIEVTYTYRKNTGCPLVTKTIKFVK